MCEEFTVNVVQKQLELNSREQVPGPEPTTMPYESPVSLYKIKFPVPENVIDDFLTATAQIEDNVSLVTGHRILMRSDHAVALRDKVKLLSGGSAGHEPGHIGFIGPGLLTATVVGDYFNSPPTNSILTAILTLAAGDHEPGILAIVNSSTGDRLSFLLAVQEAKERGIKVELLVVGDAAISQVMPKQEMRRLLADILFVYKIAGAMAEDGRSMDDIRDTCGSLPINFLNCNMNLEASEKNKWDLSIFKDNVLHEYKKCTVKDLVSESIPYVLEGGTVLHPESPTAFIINNFGCISDMEMYILAKEFVDQLGDLHFTALQLYAGTYLTSLMVSGISIAAMPLVSDELVKYLEDLTPVSIWSQIVMRVPGEEGLPWVIQENSAKWEDENVLHFGPKFGPENCEYILKVVRFVCEGVISVEHVMNSYGTEDSLGDGVSGTTHRRGAAAVLQAISYDTIDATGPHSLLTSIREVISNIGGVPGAVYDVFLEAAAESFKPLDRDGPVSIQQWMAALWNGLEVLSHFGDRVQGYLTVLDPLYSLAEALEEVVMLCWDNSDFLALPTCDQHATIVAQLLRSNKVAVDRTTLPFNLDPCFYGTAVLIHTLFQGMHHIYYNNNDNGDDDANMSTSVSSEEK